MKWTDKLPTKPGWYWYFGPYGPTIVHIERSSYFNALVVWFAGNECEALLERLPAGRWAGPITEPTEANR